MRAYKGDQLQVIPNIALDGATASERNVLKLLRNVDWGGAKARALNSLNLAKNLHQRWGEIDFLVVGPKGLIAIEVKGGDVSCGQDGLWRYEDHLGRVITRSKSPLVQAKDAFFSLERNYLSNALGRGFTRRVPCGFCVLLVGASRASAARLLGGPESPEELVGTSEDVRNARALQQFLERVARYWAAVSGSSPRIRDDDVERIVQLLRPSVDRVQPLATARGRFEEEMIALTEEQYGVLDLWDGADRILCSAPAGCGKTLLAAEMARRAHGLGERVLLVVGADALASSLRSSPGLADVVASSEQARRIMLGGDDPVARLIVDEGQQFLTRGGIALLDRLVVGGIGHGKWTWFGDSNYQLATHSTEASESMARLASAATVTPRLSKNCRNTPQIVSSVELASGAPVGHAIVRGRGEVPTMVAVADEAEAARAIAEKVGQWVDEGISLTDITMLGDAATDLTRLARRVSEIGGFATTKWGMGTGLRPVLKYATIESFRGLESEFLVIHLAGDGRDRDALAATLYLAMTRGNFAVALFARPDTLALIRANMAKNVQAMATSHNAGTAHE